MWSGLGLEGTKVLGLSRPQDHAYLRGEGCPADSLLFSGEWKAEYEEVVKTFRVLEVEQETIDAMFRVLAAIILLGDTTFEDGGDDNSVITSDMGKLVTAARHLGCASDQLQKGLITVSSEMRGEVICIHIPTSRDQEFVLTLSPWIWMTRSL